MNSSGSEGRHSQEYEYERIFHVKFDGNFISSATCSGALRRIIFQLFRDRGSVSLSVTAEGASVPRLRRFHQQGSRGSAAGRGEWLQQCRTARVPSLGGPRESHRVMAPGGSVD